MKQVIVNAQIYDFHRYIQNGYMVFDKTIIKVGLMSEYVADGTFEIDMHGHIVLPGLVCAHTHIYSTLARGLSLPFNPRNFKEILAQMWWKIDRHIDNEMSYYSSLVAGVDFLKNGVTTIIDHHASGGDITGSLTKLEEGVNEVGIRGAFAFEVSDRFDTAQAIEENVSFIESHQQGDNRGLFGLHASLTLKDETLTKVKEKLGQYPIHIHVAESAMDETDCMEKHSKRVINRLDDFGLINPDSIIVHAVHVNDEEIAIIRKRNAVIACNVTSNLNNAVGLPNILKFMDAGIPVIIGNDGISHAMASEYASLYFAMHHRYESPTKFNLDHLLTLINHTYEYVSRLFNKRIGRLEAGYVADFMVVPYVAPAPMDATNAFGHVFFGLFLALKPRFVYTAGCQRIKDYCLLDAEVMTKYENAKTISKRLWDDIKQEQ